MELAYMPDNVSFIHGIPVHRVQDTWSDVNSSVHSHVKNVPEAKIDEKNCHICRERKKKVLSTYMMTRRTKSDKMSHIREEDEEETKKGHK